MWKRNQKIQLRKCLLHFTLLSISLIKFVHTTSGTAIEHLEGEAGFRMASLQWKYPQPNQTPISFRVRYCELHNWGIHRCRYQQVVEPENKTNNRTGRHQDGNVKTLSNDVFLIEIGGLRMATNYSFQVVPQDPVLENTGQPSQISLETKGFSAKATKCLEDYSEVLIETGPFFGGRISVDESEKSGCFIRGDPLSAQTQYTLRIRHEECGSVVNGSKVTTIILVQENVPILTHSTRKFIVLCSFSPDSFTVKAGVTLPRETSVAKSLDFSKLIRISPQNSNILVADKDYTNHGSRNQQQHLQHSIQQNNNNNNNNNNENNLYELNSENNITSSTTTMTNTNLSKRQSRAYQGVSSNSNSNINNVNNNIIGVTTVTSEQMLKQNEQREGTWETYLVFGMICMAIVASLSSVGWFINSYRMSGVVGRTERLHVEDGDGDSEIGSSQISSSTFNDEHFSKDHKDHSSNHRSPHNLDTRSELEVELDFEFSEDRNPSPFHLQLDYLNQEPTSQA